jgi:DNA polymerase V
MGYYGRVSANVFSCLSEYVQELEMFSIDEAFVLLPPFADNDELSYQLYVSFVQNKLLKRTGIPVTF